MGSRTTNTWQPPGGPGSVAKTGDTDKASLACDVGPEPLLPIIHGEVSLVRRDKVAARRLQRRNTVSSLADVVVDKPSRRHHSLQDSADDGQVVNKRSSTPTFPSLAVQNQAERQADSAVTSQALPMAPLTKRMSSSLVQLSRRRSKEAPTDSNEQRRHSKELLLPLKSSLQAARRYGSKEVTLQEVPSTDAAKPTKSSKIDIVKLAREQNIPLDVVKEAAGLFRSWLPPEQREADFDYLSDARLPMATVNEMLGDLVQRKPMPDQVDFKQFADLFCCQGFSEGCALTQEERDMREIGRQHGISVPDLDHYKLCFDKFATDGSGHIGLQGFRALISHLTKVPEGSSLPANRISQLWLEADQNRNGQLDFEEFVLFYRKYFDDESAGSCPFESFYSFTRIV